MSAIQRTLRHAARRVTLHHALRGLGVGLLVGLTLALLAVLAAKLLGLAWSWPLPAAPVAAGAALGVAVAWFRRPSPDQVAAMVDARCGLKDRIGTARYLDAADAIDTPAARHPFADTIRQQAEDAAANQATGDKLRAAFAITFTKAWRAVPAAAVLLALVAWLIPDDALGLAAQRVARANQQAEDETRDDELQQIETTIREVSAEPRPDDTGSVPEADLDELLDQITELGSQRLTNPDADALRRAAIDERRERIEQIAEDRQRAMDALNNQLSQLDSGQDNDTGKAFEDALRRGDFESAQQELDDLARQLQDDSLTAEERAALGKRFRELSRQLADQARAAAARAEDAKQRTRELLEDAGVDPDTIDDLEDQGFNPEDVHQALDDADADDNQRGATDDALDDQRDAEQQQQDSQNLAEPLDDLADEADPQDPAQQQDPSDPSDPSDPGSQGEPQDNSSSGNNNPQDGGEPRDASDRTGSQPNGQPQNGSSDQVTEPANGGEQPGGEPNQQPGSQPGQQPGEQPGQQPGNQPGQQPGDQQPGDQPGNQPGNQPGDQPGNQPGSQPGGEQPGNQPGDQPGSGAGQSQSAEGSAQGGSRSESSGGEGNTPGNAPGGGAQRTREQLQRLADKKEQADEAAAAAAQSARGGTPGGWGTGDGGPVSGPERRLDNYNTDQARDVQDGTDGRQIATWEGAGELAPGQATQQYRQVTRSSREQAERALSDQAVPARFHDSIRQYFDQRTSTTPPPPPPPTTSD